MRTTTAARAAVAAAVALLLAGCGQGTPEDTQPTTLPPVPAATEPAPTEATPTEPPEPTGPETDEPTTPVVNGPNSITAPLPGSTVEGPTVVVTGEGTAFEATLNYRVLAEGSDEPVAEGFTMAGANGEVGPWTVELQLEPGEYTVEVWEPDMSDGESTLGPHLNLVSTTFTVS